MPILIKILTAADLHRLRSHYQALAQAVKNHQPDIVALVGDFLDASGSLAPQLTTAECAYSLLRLTGREIVFIRGNHEDSAWWEFADIWSKKGRPMNTLHGDVFVKGPMALLGFPCGMGDETAFMGIRESLPEDATVWLSQLLRSHGPAIRTLWLMHETPTGTPLSRQGTPVAGNPEWNHAIDQYSPWLTISGHDHSSPSANKCWYNQIGQTACVNVGQSESELHYCVIEAEFAGSAVSLPSKIKVTAYPWDQSITLPLGIKG